MSLLQEVLGGYGPGDLVHDYVERNFPSWNETYRRAPAERARLHDLKEQASARLLRVARAQASRMGSAETLLMLAQRYVTPAIRDDERPELSDPGKARELTEFLGEALREAQIIHTMKPGPYGRDLSSWAVRDCVAGVAVELLARAFVLCRQSQ